eukprot:g8685.t1
MHAKPEPEGEQLKVSWEEYCSIVEAIALAACDGNTTKQLELQRRLEQCQVQEDHEYLQNQDRREDEASAGQASDGVRDCWRKHEHAEKRTTISDEEAAKIRDQVRRFEEGEYPETVAQEMHLRRIAAVLPDAVETCIVDSIREAWRKQQVPVLRFELDATNLGVLLPSPLSRELLRGGSRCVLDPSSKFLCAIVSTQFLDESGSEWSLSSRVVAPMPAAVLPSAPAKGFLGEAEAEAEKTKKGEETGKLARIGLEHIKPILHKIFQLPVETPEGSIGKPEDSRCLMVEIMGDSGGSAVPVQKQIINAIGFWAPACPFPLFTLPGFCEEHPEQTLSGESSSGLRRLMVPLDKRKKPTSGEKETAAASGASSAANQQAEAGAVAEDADPPPGKKQNGKAAKKKAGAKKKASGKAAASMANKLDAMNGAEYKDDDATYVANPHNCLLQRRTEDPAAGGDPMAGGFDWNNDDHEDDAGGDGEDANEELGATIAGSAQEFINGAAASSSGANDKAESNGKEGDAKKKKPKKKDRDYFTQFSFSLNRLVAHQRRNLFLVIKKKMEKTGRGAVVEWWTEDRKEEFETERAATEALLARHGLWDFKQQGVHISYALTSGKVVMLRDKTTLVAVIEELLALLPNTRPGSDTRWWSIGANSRLGVGFGLLRMCWDEIELSGVHVGSGDYTPDNFSICEKSKTTLLDWAVLCHHVELAGGPAAGIGASTYKTAAAHAGRIDLNKPEEFRHTKRMSKFFNSARSSMQELRPKCYDRDVLRLTSNRHDAVEYHRPLRVETVAAVMKSVGGFLYRFGAREAYQEFFYWIRAELLALGADASEEQLCAKLNELLERPDLISLFRTKTLELIDSGLLVQLKRIKSDHWRLRMCRAALAYCELLDPHSIRVEFQHQVLQSAQKSHGAWKGDRALNAHAYASFVEKVLAEDLEAQYARTHNHLLREEKERLMFQDEILRFDRYDPAYKYRAWLRCKTDEILDEEEERAAGPFSQATYKKQKHDAEKVESWFRLAAGISRELVSERISTIEELQKKKAELKAEIKRRAPAKQWWGKVIQLLPDYAFQIPARRIREFERDMIFDFEKRATCPLVDINLCQYFDEQSDVVAPELASPLGRFISRVLQSKKDQWMTRKIDEPLELLAFTHDGEVYVVWWALGRPAAQVAIGIGPELGTVDLTKLLEDEDKMKALYSYDASLQKVSLWSSFFFVSMAEVWESFHSEGVVVNFELVAEVSRSDHLGPDDRDALFAETGEKIARVRPVREKAKPSERIRVGATISNWLDLLEQGRYCTARTLAAQVEHRRRKEKLQRKVRAARKLARKKRKDAELARAVKTREMLNMQELRDSQWMQDDIIYAASAIFEDFIEHWLGGLLEELEDADLLDLEFRNPEERERARQLAAASSRGDERGWDGELNLQHVYDGEPLGNSPAAVVKTSSHDGTATGLAEAAATAEQPVGKSWQDVVEEQRTVVDLSTPRREQEGEASAWKLYTDMVPLLRAVHAEDAIQEQGQQKSNSVNGSSDLSHRASEAVGGGPPLVSSASSSSIVPTAVADAARKAIVEDVCAEADGAKASASKHADAGPRSPRIALPTGGSSGQADLTSRSAPITLDVHEDDLFKDWDQSAPRNAIFYEKVSDAEFDDETTKLFNMELPKVFQDSLAGSADRSDAENEPAVSPAAAAATPVPPTSLKRSRARRSPQKLLDNDYKDYQKKLEEQRRAVEESLGGFELVLRGSATVYKKGADVAATAKSASAQAAAAPSGPGKQMQGKPRARSNEGDNCIRLWNTKGGHKLLCCQEGACLKARDFQAGAQQKSDDYIRLWIARARFISQRWHDNEHGLGVKTLKLTRQQRVKMIPTHFAEYIKPLVERAKAHPNGKRELKQIKELETLPDDPKSLILLAVVPLFLDKDEQMRQNVEQYPGGRAAGVV